MTSADPKRVAAHPNLILGFSLAPPGNRPAFHAVAALRRIAQAGLPVGLVLGDTAYGPVRLLEDYAQPLRELGYRLTANLHSRDRGMNFTVRGAAFVEDHLYCPAIRNRPELVRANADYLEKDAADRIDHETWTQRVAARQPFQVRPNGRMQGDGSIRVTCPAMGPNPTLVCPLRPRRDTDELIVAGVHTLAKHEVPEPEARGALCHNKAGDVTIRDPQVARHYADVPFGTKEFRRRYSTYRNTIESANRHLKDPAQAGLEDGRKRRMRGFTAVSVLLACQIAAFNISRIEGFTEPETDKQGRTPLKPKRSRRQGIDSWIRPRTFIFATDSDPPER